MTHQYSPTAVDAAIASSNRAGRKVSRREGKLIHALLKGRTPMPDEDECPACEGSGRIYNNADTTSGQWVHCEDCQAGRD